VLVYRAEGMKGPGVPLFFQRDEFYSCKIVILPDDFGIPFKPIFIVRLFEFQFKEQPGCDVTVQKKTHAAVAQILSKNLGERIMEESVFCLGDETEAVVCASVFRHFFLDTMEEVTAFFGEKRES